MDPAKTCLWQRYQHTALGNKGSLTDAWLPLKESGWLGLFTVSCWHQQGMKTVSRVPACLCTLWGWIQTAPASHSITYGVKLDAGCCRATCVWCSFPKELRETIKKGAEPHMGSCGIWPSKKLVPGQKSLFQVREISGYLSWFLWKENLQIPSMVPSLRQIKKNFLPNIGHVFSEIKVNWFASYKDRILGPHYQTSWTWIWGQVLRICTV